MGIDIPAPGGNDWSHATDKQNGLHRYVHLCFRQRHPMEFLARQDGRIVDSIFLQIRPQMLKVGRRTIYIGRIQQIRLPMFDLKKVLAVIDFEVLYSWMG